MTTASLNSSKLNGLVLAGGLSTRMGQDKASLRINGLSLVEHARILLQKFCTEVYVSVRKPTNDPLTLPDAVDAGGPLSGILTAQKQFPDRAWLVLACDLPLVDRAVLEKLVTQRNSEKIATAYRSSFDNLPEPLCAIYEPQSHAVLLSFVARGIYCPRKIMINSDIHPLTQDSADSLYNVNHPADWAYIQKKIGGEKVTGEIREVSIRYYAILRDQAARSAENYSTASQSLADLYEELRQRHGFRLPISAVKVARNGEFTSVNENFCAGDQLVFMPPVSGG